MSAFTTLAGLAMLAASTKASSFYVGTHINRIHRALDEGDCKKAWSSLREVRRDLRESMTKTTKDILAVDEARQLVMERCPQ